MADQDRNGFLSREEIAVPKIKAIVAPKSVDLQLFKQKFGTMTFKKGRTTEDVFKLLDANSDGVIDKREVQGHLKSAQREGSLTPGRKIKDEVDLFFRSADDNGDMRVTFDEYKQLWVHSKKKKKGGGGARERFPPIFSMAFVNAKLEQLRRLAEAARAYAQQSPYVALSGIGVMSAAVYVGGMAVRLW